MAYDLGDIAQLITALMLVVTTVSTLRNGYKANKLSKEINVIKVATDGMKDALVASTAKASLAEGKAIGIEQGKSEK